MSFKRGFGSSQAEEVGGWAAKWMKVLPSRANCVMKALVSERRWAAFLCPGSSKACAQK